MFGAIAWLVGLSSCQPNGRETLTIFAASSLRDVLAPMVQEFEERHPGTQVEVQFLGSQQLATQIVHGARADLFLSANRVQVERLRAAGLDVQATAFLQNELAVFARPGIESFADLAGPGLKIILAAPAVPAGRYTSELLEKARQDPQYGPSFVDALRTQVVSLEPSVRAAASKVGLGEADAAIVYRTDINQEEGATVEIPERLRVETTYFAVLLPHGAKSELAGEFLARLKSGTARRAFESAGFLVP